MERKKEFTKLTCNGISLIVLIITVIVIIILATAVILNISQNNPVESSKEATFKSDVRSFQNDLALTVTKEYTDLQGQRDYKITTSENPKFDEIKNYIPSFTKKYEKKLGIEDDELVYFPDKVTDDEKKWLEDLGINPYGYKIKEADEECFKWDGNTIIGIKNEELFIDSLRINNYVLKIPVRCKAIGEHAFEKRAILKRVIIPDGLLVIKKGAFWMCTNLLSINIPTSINRIEDAAFSHCESLDNVVIPEGITRINDYVFFCCYSLKSIILPDSLKTISAYSFGSCKNLKNIDIKNAGLLEYAFCGCSSLEVINIPNQKCLYKSTFRGCSSLTSVTLPNSIVRIERWCFSRM